MRYIGGGSKKIIRIVDFKRNKDGVPAVVKTIAVSYTHLDVYKRQPLSKQILVQENDYVRAGTPLSDGAITPAEDVYKRQLQKV